MQKIEVLQAELKAAEAQLLKLKPASQDTPTAAATTNVENPEAADVDMPVARPLSETADVPVPVAQAVTAAADVDMPIVRPVAPVAEPTSAELITLLESENAVGLKAPDGAAQWSQNAIREYFQAVPPPAVSTKPAAAPASVATNASVEQCKKRVSTLQAQISKLQESHGSFFRLMEENKRRQAQLANKISQRDFDPVEDNWKATDDSAGVKGVLKRFGRMYMEEIQNEQARVARAADGAGKHARPDLQAMKRCKDTGVVVHKARKTGILEGIQPGFRFFARCEMVVVGMHGKWMGGIDWIKDGPATCVVVSGGYADDVDNGEELVYTGQGGNDINSSRKQVKDQVLKSGNLALTINVDKGLPVRLVRGHIDQESYTGKVYTYDGLYDVTEWFPEKGIEGFTVYKYRLRRCSDQPPLSTDPVSFKLSSLPSNTKVMDREGVKMEDITKGLEKRPIPVVCKLISLHAQCLNVSWTDKCD